jgi:uncharacterized repeat protein (TIGR01451 family)
MMGKREFLGRFERRTRGLRRRPACELMERRLVLSSFSVTSTGDSTDANTLRWAILGADAATGPSSISFDIPGGGVQVIKLSQPLPAITNTVVIDGTSQPNYAGSPLIQIDGSGLVGPGNNGLVFSAGSSTVEGLSIVGFSGSAVVLNPTANGSQVIADYLGFSAASGQAGPNGTGISVNGSSNNTIGGTSAGSANVISGNTGDGVLINAGGGTASSNDIYGNLIGTNPAGTLAVGNGQCGIDLVAASGTAIGFAAAGSGNVISGNAGAGIQLLSGATGNVIQNNDIGLALDATSALGNGSDGIYLNGSPGNQIGGTDLLQANVIGSNLGNGVNAQGNSSSTLVEGNYIGTDVTATLNRGNQNNGIELGSSSNTIGGTVSGAGNTIDFNGAGQSGSGVQLVGSPTFDQILSNSIYENAVLGINLGDGPTSNHQPGTAGPNNYQNYPVLSGAQSDGASTTIQGKLNAAPSVSYLIQFFCSATASASGFGQGQTLIGSYNLQTNASGLATFLVPVPAGTLPGTYISATATDPSGDTSEFAEDVPVQGQINLVLSGTVSPTPVGAGGEVTYTLTVSNEGSIDATNVMVQNTLPGGVNFIYAKVSQGYTEPFEGSSQTGDLLTIAPGGSATMTVVGLVPTNASVGTIVDTASVTSTQVDPSPTDESVVLDDTVATVADLAVQLTAAPGSILAGAELTYTVAVNNDGPQTAHNVSVTLPIVSGEAFVSSTAASATDANGQVTIALGDMTNGASTSFQVVVQALAAGTLTENATVSSSSLDPNLSNNTSTVTTQVAPAADLQVALSSSKSPIVLGSDFDYIVTLTNAGPSEANGIVLTDTLPAGAQFVLASSDQDVTPAYSAGVVTLSLSTLQSGSTAKLTIEMNPQAAPGASLTDSASVTDQVPDPDLGNNSATLVTPVIGVSDLGITATTQESSVYVGQNIEYLLSVSNQGPYAEPDAVVSWNVPAAASFVSADCPQGTGATIAPGVVHVDVGPIGSGDTVGLSLIVTPLAGAAGQFTTTFTVQGENFDPVTSNNSAPVAVQVTPAANLAVTITPGQTGPSVDSSWTYTETVSNLGLSDATGVVLSSPLPGNVTLTSATPSQGPPVSFQNGVASASLGAIPAGQSAFVTFVVVPTSVTPVTVPVSVAGDQYDPSLANNQASLTVSTSPSARLSVTVAPGSSSVTCGQSWSFTATVQNTGPDPATNVVMTIPLTGGLVFGSATPTQGTTSSTGTVILAQFGQINPGSSASVKVVVTTTAFGSVAQTASVTSAENQLNPGGLSGHTSVNILESPGILQFAAATYSVSEEAGSAELVVTRSAGALGAVNVGYQTVSAGATPGLDYVASSGTLSFANGATTATIQVQVLPDPWEDHDEYVNVVLDSPTGGTVIGPQGTSLLRIIDVAPPNVTSPEVTGLSWAGTSRSITSLTIAFSEPLEQTYAMNSANYQLVAPGLGNKVVPLTPESYSVLGFSVTLAPSIALPTGQYYYIQVVGSGPSAIRDISGNLLDGAGNGQAGSNYQASFAQGTQLKYVDGSGNKVSLKLAGSGYLEQVRDASGDGVVLDLVGIKPFHSTLSGTVKAPVSHAVRKNKPARSTELGVIEGLGNFGDVKVLLTSPPFEVKYYPFQRRGKGVL